MNKNLFRLAGWSALTVAILTLLTLITFGIGYGGFAVIAWLMIAKPF
jgi:hypothetical protein